MNFFARVSSLVNALMLATMAIRANKGAPVRIVAAGSTVSFICADPDIAIKAEAVATVLEPGATALSADRLMALTSGFAADTMVG